MTRTTLAFLMVYAVPLVWACKSAPLSSGEVEAEYPYTYEQKSLSELTDLNSDYHQQNGGKICSTLNEYGLTGYSRILFPNDINPCLSRSVSRVELAYSERLEEQARASIGSNAAYTMVDDKSKLVLKDVLPLNGCTICEGPDINNVPIEWKLTFEHQKLEGVPVEGTRITAYVDAGGVNRIWGNWYKVADPGYPVVGYIQGRNRFSGLFLSYQTDLGQVNEQQIELSQVEETPELRFSPILKGKVLEIRKCWVFSISDQSSGEPLWEGYVDTITGEIQKVEVL